MEDQEKARMLRLREQGFNEKEIARMRGVGIVMVRKLIGPAGKKDKIHTVEGNTGTIKELCELYNVNRYSIDSRVNKGMTLEEAILKPIKKRLGTNKKK